MTIKRFGKEGSKGVGGQDLPFSNAVEADGWLFISGQTPMRNGEVVEGGIVEQSRIAIGNCINIMERAGYSLDEVVHVTVILTDARYFTAFNKVFRETFGNTPPARICMVSELVVDCKVEVDMKCYKQK